MNETNIHMLKLVLCNIPMLCANIARKKYALLPMGMMRHHMMKLHLKENIILGQTFYSSQVGIKGSKNT